MRSRSTHIRSLPIIVALAGQGASTTPFLIGIALIGEGDEHYMHSVFLGCVPRRLS